ncbi:unnamed protein product [Rotaria magnacalcarata]|uniref:F-box domain-containing protein n=2 Tax=Rotaria magnacalcarata TaxID=392030 RepID=A0A814VDA9_9BILA|nr:unnamed protein product [Rotaria magnacalcarata]CAF1613516.1 unnamed protein product [Rotaria magnacalcarata]CAF2042105.1 unnamed protein product [Rotaria magnacalcarata]CAF3861129.1 unnamed protein product [Rotaria magnacalcarata]CAF3962300.1 unnamed protein product [Rotaria magnacalcarata]
MDSGPFLDVISTLLSYLDLKSLIRLAQTCCFWKDRIYNDLKLWPKVIELPFIGQMEDGFYGRYEPETVVKAKLWSMILPPNDPKALEKVLGKMASSNESVQRFLLVEKVLFKNFIHTDESLRLTALLFPSIQEISFEGDLFTVAGVEYIAASCRKLKHIEFYRCKTVNIASACRLFNTEDHKQNLERLFIYQCNSSMQLNHCSDNNDLPFMPLCQRCGLYFNELKNEDEMLCLYHPGTYDGYGHSCSSFSCCGSNTPNYQSTLGCQYTYHQKYDGSSSNRTLSRQLHSGHPEYMFQKYAIALFPLCFTERRQLHQCYKQWNDKQQQEENQ